MSDILVARRYARALHKAGQEVDALDEVDADVSVIRTSLDASRELVRFFESPVVSRERKLRVVQALFGSRVGETTMRFMDLLIRKRREDLFPQVVEEYGRLRDKQLGILGVTVRSAEAPDGDDTAQLREALESWTGSQVKLVTRHDRSLIGGLVIRIGDTVYDGSVRNKLEHLREQFASGSYRAS